MAETKRMTSELQPRDRPTLSGSSLTTALEPLAAGVVIEQNDERLVVRRYFSNHSREPVLDHDKQDSN